MINDTFVGADTSLRKTGMCVLESKYVFLYLIETKKLRGARRLSYIGDAARGILEDHSTPDIGAIEAGAYNAGGRVFQLGQVQGIVQQELYHTGADILEISPTRLKKFFANHGSAGKEKMVNKAEELLGSEVPGDDLADAFALAHLAEAFRAEKPRTRKQAEVLLDIELEEAV